MAMVSGSDMFCRPASATSPALSECAENSPSAPANAHRSFMMSRNSLFVGRPAGRFRASVL